MSANKLASLNQLFGELKETNKDDEKDKVKKVTTKSLVPFSKHPFRLYTGRKLDDMVRSIKEFGILQPLIVRVYKSDSVQFKDFNVETTKYEILAGHNRWNAATLAGLEEVPIVIMEGLTDEDAMLVVIETNLIQRSFTEMSHSERALVLAKHHDALKCQGKRVDLIEEVKILLYADGVGDDETFRPVGEKLDADEKTGQEYSLSGRSVSRYLRINTLSDDLKKYIDTEEISIRAGVELSYLSEDNQIYLVDVLNNNKFKIDIKIASKLRELQKQKDLNESIIESVLGGTFDKPIKTYTILSGVKLKSKVIKKYFNEKQTEKEVEEIIDKALDFYFTNGQVH